MIQLFSLSNASTFVCGSFENERLLLKGYQIWHNPTGRIFWG
jgi:hypothetical protein